MVTDRLEMVVKGRRHTALSTTPLLGGPSLLGTGFIMEEHSMRTFEMPDHWIPNYLVTFQMGAQPAKRLMFEAGRTRETIIENGLLDVVASQEVRKFRLEGEVKSLILSIEPEVLLSMIATPKSGESFELIRLWRGSDDILRSLMLRLRAEIEGAFRLDHCLQKIYVQGWLKSCFSVTQSRNRSWINTGVGFREAN